MSVKLIKKQEGRNKREKRTLPLTSNQIFVNTKAWVDEFRARKNRDAETLAYLSRRR
jgi:hypothetical protein